MAELIDLSFGLWNRVWAEGRTISIVFARLRKCALIWEGTLTQPGQCDYKPGEYDCVCGDDAALSNYILTTCSYTVIIRPHRIRRCSLFLQTE